jgi:predicted RNA methylase
MPFDPNQPFTVVSDSAPPPFDPSKPFKLVTDLSKLNLASIAEQNAAAKQYTEGQKASDFLQAVTDPKTGLPARTGQAVGYVGNIAKAIPADVAETVAGNEKYYELKNLAGAALGEEPEITGKISQSASESPTAATIAKIGQGFAGSAPMLGVGALPEWAAKLASLGFSAQMIQSGGQSAKALGEELGKNPDDRDADKITSAVSDLSQSALFAPLAAKFGAVDAIEGKFRPNDLVIRKLAEQLKSDPLNNAAPYHSITQPVTPKAPAVAVTPDLGASLMSAIKGNTPKGWSQPAEAGAEPLKISFNASEPLNPTPTPPEGKNAPTVTPEAAKPILTPALLVDGKPVTGGATHKEIYENALARATTTDEKVALHEAQHVFVDESGKVYSRDEGAKALGLDKPLHSEMLPALENKPLPVKAEVKPSQVSPVSAGALITPERSVTDKGSVKKENVKPSGFNPPPMPERFDSLQDVIAYRNKYRASELAFYKSLGLDDKDAMRMMRAADSRSNLDTSSIEAKLTAENQQRLDDFSTGEGSEMYQWDRQYDPEELTHETDKSELARHVVQNLSRESLPNEFGDKMLHAVVALRQLKENGGTWSDVARELDKHTTRNSSSQGDKAEIFKMYGEKIKQFAAQQGIDLPQGELGARLSSPRPSAIPQTSEPPPTSGKPAASIRQGAGESPKPFKGMNREEYNADVAANPRHETFVEPGKITGISVMPGLDASEGKYSTPKKNPDTFIVSDGTGRTQKPYKTYPMSKWAEIVGKLSKGKESISWRHYNPESYKEKIGEPPTPKPSTPAATPALTPEEQRMEQVRLSAEMGVDEGSPEAKPSKPAVSPERATRLRNLADAMQNQIDSLRNSGVSQQNPTARRARIAGNMSDRADSIEKVQQAARALADAHEVGDVPPVVSGITTKAQLEEILQRSAYPHPYINRGALRGLIKDLEGKPGIVGIRSQLRYGEDARLSPNEVEAVKKLMKLADKYNVRTSSLNYDLSGADRLRAAGIRGSGDWQEAKDWLTKNLNGPSAEHLAARKLKDLENGLLGTKIPGFFPTPKPVIAEMLSRADIQPGMKVLEPSAGKGDIADAVKATGADVDTVESQHSLADILRAKGYEPSQGDFLSKQIGDLPLDKYDRIVMNPPFEKGQDAAHVEHAYKFLKPGGRLVAIMSEGTFFRETQIERGFRDWLESVGGTSEKLPEGSFTGKDAFRQTGTATRIVEIHKPEGRESGDLSSGSPKERKKLLTPEELKGMSNEQAEKAVNERRADINDLTIKQQLEKEGHKDTLLAFRLGDFYEFFFDDAKAAAQHLKLSLTNRNGVDMAGIPYHAAQSYFGKLVSAGKKVAVVDTDPAALKSGKPVERKVTGIVGESPAAAVQKVATQVPKSPKSETIKIPAKSYPYGDNGSGVESVTGSVVKLKADPANDYFAYKFSNNLWKVVEKSTGLSPGDTYGKTKAAAVLKAEANVEKAGGSEKMSELIKSAEKLNGDSGDLSSGKLGKFGMGGAKPAEFERSQQTPTGVKNATVDAERAKRGLPPAMEPARHSFGEVWDKAMAMVDKDPQAQQDLIDELRKTPRALTDTEDAMLLQRQIALQNDYGEATRELAQAHDDAQNAPNEEAAASRAADAVELKTRVARLSDELLDLYNINKRVGTETGRGLNARKMMAYEDYSLAEMETRLRSAKGGKPLTPEESAKIKELSDTVQRLQKQIDDYDERATEEKPRYSQVVIKIAERVVSTLDSRAEAARQRIRERAGRLNAGIDPTLLADYAEIGASHLAHMGLDFAKWSDAMITEFGDTVKPHLKKIFEASQRKADSLAEEMAPQNAEVKRAVKKQASGNPALKALKTRYANRAEELKAKMAGNDFTPKGRTPIQLDAEAIKLKSAYERSKLEFDRLVMKERLKNRNILEKTQDTFTKWRRAFLLSSPVTLAKLTSAAVERLAFTPIEEGVGSVFSRVPGLRGVAERAPREGGMSVKAEARALTEGLRKGMADSWQTLRTGHSDMDSLFGKRDVMPRAAIDMIGSIHGALKAPVKSAEYFRSLQKRIEFAIRQGQDPTDPLVMTRLCLDSYKDAQRSIFMQDNRVSSAWQSALANLERPDKKTGKVPNSYKALATVGKTLLPIVKVPTNIVAETLQTAFGSVTGSARLAHALYKGVETLKPDEADLIMRELKKGSLGAALLVLGYLNPSVIGGYYQMNDKKQAGHPKFGSVQIGGQNIPTWLIHNPLLETLQIGATIRHVADSKLRKKDNETQGVPAGTMAALLGITSEVPFAREPVELTKMFNPYERPKFENQFAKDMIVPLGVSWVAQHFDKNANGNYIARDQSDFANTIKSAIPLLRKSVPEDFKATAKLNQ